MFEEDYKILYFTTPFCGVCQSARKVIEILALSLEVKMEEINMNHFSNTFENLMITMTPSVALIYKNEKVVYYTETINNLADLYQRFEQARNEFMDVSS